jgi:hypothetical protein
MGSRDEDIPQQPVQKTKFVEDMDESEIQSAMEMPAGLQVLHCGLLSFYCSGIE